MKNPRAKILITDDEKNIRLMLLTALEPQCYELSEAADGSEALAAIDASVPDLVILDLNMPVLDGIGVLERLQAWPASAGVRPLVIVLTAYGSIPLAVKATRLGAADFLEKPITPDELRETVRGVLAEGARRAPAAPGENDLAGGYEAVLSQARRALKADDTATAESMLMRAADLSAGREAPYFNLLGVLYEAQRNWRLAKKFYGKSIHADRKYSPAQENMKRIYELETFGGSKVPVTLDKHDPSPLDMLREQRRAGRH